MPYVQKCFDVSNVSELDIAMTGAIQAKRQIATGFGTVSLFMGRRLRAARKAFRLRFADSQGFSQLSSAFAVFYLSNPSIPSGNLVTTYLKSPFRISHSLQKRCRLSVVAKFYVGTGPDISKSRGSRGNFVFNSGVRARSANNLTHKRRVFPVAETLGDNRKRTMWNLLAGPEKK